MDFYTNAKKRGKYILYRGVENGKRVRRKVEYQPTLFVPSRKPSKYKTLYGENVEPVEPGNMRDCADFIEQYKEVQGFTIYGNTKYEYAFISDNFSGSVLWDNANIEVAYLDIEVGSENGFPEPKTASEEITAITIKHKNRYFVFGCSEYRPSQENVEYVKCSDEIELIKKFIDVWTTIWPDIVTGWNIKFFDIPYIVNRITRLLGEKEAQRLSPWNVIADRTTYIMGREQVSHEIFGVAILDYLELYRKFGASSARESYRLDYIAHLEIGEKKVSYEEYGNLHQLYKQNFQKFIDYNIHDVTLIERLDDKMRLIELALTLAYNSKVNYDDVFKQTRMWDSLIYNHLKTDNIVIPQMKDSVKSEPYEGAYVKDPIVGMHDWIASFDLTSLYPHLIMQYNLSPETLVKPEDYTEEMTRFMESNTIDVGNLLLKKVDTSGLKDQKITVTPNKQLFRTDKQGFLGKMMQDMYESRAKYKTKAIAAKKEMETTTNATRKKQLEKEVSQYNNLQLAVKECLNSAYGAIGNEHFRHFDIRIAEAITTAGQLSIRWIENEINEYLNKLLKTEKIDYVLASDTDSIVLNLGPLIQKIIGRSEATEDKKKTIRFMDRLCKDKFQPFIDKAYQALADYINVYEQKMFMKREALGDKAIWTAKKRYIINVFNSEGVEYAKPMLKLMGLEVKKSSTPAFFRDKMEKCIFIMINSNQKELIEYINSVRHDMTEMDISDIAFPRGVNGLQKYSDSENIFSSGCPIHVRGSLIYNNLLVSKKLDKIHQKINEGEKIKFIYMKEPNPTQSNVIAFPLSLPKELGLEKYIDYDTQFSKGFLDPIKIITDSIDWKTEVTFSLEDFFT